MYKPTLRFYGKSQELGSLFFFNCMALSEGQALLWEDPHLLTGLYGSGFMATCSEGVFHLVSGFLIKGICP